MESEESLSDLLFVAAIILLLALPWLNPFAPGPSPAVAPFLFSWCCVAASWGLAMSNPPSAKRIAFIAGWSWLIAGFISSSLGLLQYFGVAAEFNPWINQTGYGEAFANLRQRNQFASLTNIALVTLVWMVQQYLKRSGESKSHYLGMAMVTAGLLAVGNAISSSRTGLFQLLLICILSGVWGGWRRVWIRRILIGASVAYAAALFAMPYLAGLDVFAHGALSRMRQDEACGSRLILWSNVLQLIAERPWLGWGWGELDYAHYITLYQGTRFCDILDNAHNLPLHLAVELGIPVALLVCGGFTWWVLRQRPWLEADPTRQLAWSVLAVILLHSMLEYPLWYGPFQMAFWICIGLLWRPALVSGEASHGGKNALNGPVERILKASLAIILIAVTAFAAWDYNRISQIYLAPEARDAAYRNNTLEKISKSWFFDNQLRFAQLLVTPLTAKNAEWTFNTATVLLHYSPEPRVIEKIIESAVLLKRDTAALEQMLRYRAAFPLEYSKWAIANAKVASALGALK